MKLFVSRNGQTFGPYTVDQAKQYLQAGQLLANDYAMFEGGSEWKTLHELVIQTAPTPAQEQSASVPQQETIPENGKPKVKKKEGSRKVKKLSSGPQVQTVFVAQKKGIFSKIFSTIFVFSFMMFLAVGGIAGAYFVMPTKVGPILAKFGIPVEKMQGLIPVTDLAPDSISSGEALSPDEVFLDPGIIDSLKLTGFRIMGVENGKGVQVIAPADPPTNDEELEKLLPIASHVISLDLTNSKITDLGINIVQKLSNLQKLNLEGSTEISHVGVAKLKSLEKLEHLNVINVKMADDIVSSLLEFQSLREVYLFKSGISEEAVRKLKTDRPEMFVNAG
jgi:hypothetical protein